MQPCMRNTTKSFLGWYQQHLWHSARFFEELDNIFTTYTGRFNSNDEARSAGHTLVYLHLNANRCGQMPTWCIKTQGNTGICTVLCSFHILLYPIHIKFKVYLDISSSWVAERVVANSTRSRGKIQRGFMGKNVNRKKKINIICPL